MAETFDICQMFLLNHFLGGRWKVPLVAGASTPPHVISKITLLSDKQQTGLDRPRRDKSYKSFYRSGQNWSHQRSPKVLFWENNDFPPPPQKKNRYDLQK